MYTVRSSLYGGIFHQLTSTASGASGRSISKRKVRTAPSRKRWQFYVRNNKGRKCPAFDTYQSRAAPRPGVYFALQRYRSAQINAAPRRATARTKATAALEDVFKQTMPREMASTIRACSFQEQKAREGVPARLSSDCRLLFVFLILAALYESWSLPFSVLFEHAGGDLWSL